MKHGFILRALAMVSLVTLAVPAALSLEGCSSKSSKTKGGGAKGAAAKDAGQKVGGTASGDTSSATDSGAVYEEVTCDDTDDGLAWCDSDTSLVFCSGGHFYLLDCSGVGGDVCGDDGSTIDCYAEADF
jgi:hypothetical protein